jgi:hypothetical protein
LDFPNYQTTFKKLYTLDNNQNRQIRVIWANDTGAPSTARSPELHGSVLIFEDYAPQLTTPAIRCWTRTADLFPLNLRTVFVMKKDHGFGTEYGPIRNGEWEYVSTNRTARLRWRLRKRASAVCHYPAAPSRLPRLPP